MVDYGKRPRIPRQIAVSSDRLTPAASAPGRRVFGSQILMTASMPPLHNRPSEGSQRTASPNSSPPHRPPSLQVVSALGRVHMAYGMMVASSSSLVLRAGDWVGLPSTLFVSGALGLGTFWAADVLNREWYAPQKDKIPAMAAYRTAGFQLGNVLGVLLGASYLLAPLSGALMVALPAAAVALLNEIFIRRSLR